MHTHTTHTHIHKHTQTHTLTYMHTHHAPIYMHTQIHAHMELMVFEHTHTCTTGGLLRSLRELEPSLLLLTELWWCSPPSHPSNVPPCVVSVTYSCLKEVCICVTAIMKVHLSFSYPNIINTLLANSTCPLYSSSLQRELAAVDIISSTRIWDSTVEDCLLLKHQFIDNLEW